MTQTSIEDSLFYKTFSDALKRLYEKQGILPDFMQEIIYAKAEMTEAAQAEAEAAKVEAEAAKTKNAKLMLQGGLPVETVIKYSGLPRETIYSLAVHKKNAP
ncbi:MAG: hypothetical protein LBT44_04275 [Clostridiales bacterium]|nr:hypothetical protein [Clostridiales bacterium]